MIFQNKPAFLKAYLLAFSLLYTAAAALHIQLWGRVVRDSS